MSSSSPLTCRGCKLSPSMCNRLITPAAVFPPRRSRRLTRHRTVPAGPVLDASGRTAGVTLYPAEPVRRRPGQRPGDFLFCRGPCCQWGTGRKFPGVRLGAGAGTGLSLAARPRRTTSSRSLIAPPAIREFLHNRTLLWTIPHAAYNVRYLE